MSRLQNKQKKTLSFFLMNPHFGRAAPSSKSTPPHPPSHPHEPQRTFKWGEYTTCFINFIPSPDSAGCNIQKFEILTKNVCSSIVFLDEYNFIVYNPLLGFNSWNAIWQGKSLITSLVAMTECHLCFSYIIHLMLGYNIWLQLGFGHRRTVLRITYSMATMIP
jgi:hypothetical protein